MNADKKKLPPIGARIVKSALGAAICMLISFLRELLPIGGGIPFYSVLAVLWCMQPYTTTTLTMAKQRTIGTFVGAAYGLVFLRFFQQFPWVGKHVVYLCACAMLIVILYTTVLLNKRNASYFSCVVFLTIAINHSFDTNPYLFVFNRVLDTLVGIGVGVGLNVIHMPIKKGDSTLYVSGIDSVLVSSRETMIPYNKVELNRLIARGAHFTVSTIRTPASMLDLLSGIDLKLPVIAMDGAVLYDIKENRYLDTVPLSRETAQIAERIIDEEGAHTFVNALYDNTLHIYYGVFCNDAERDMFEKLRRSPYRNYTKKCCRTEQEQVLYLMVLAPDAQIQRICRRLQAELGGRIRITTAPAAEYPGYTYLKLYDQAARKDNMIEILRQRTGVKRVVTVGSIPGAYDIFVSDDGGNAAVKAIKKMYRAGGLCSKSQRREAVIAKKN